jgi:SNF family Na+-dependent transporter
MPQPRELWKTRIGLVLATAGNAVGLGNFLRFPVQCAENGGGAFMVPYFISLLVFGIPLMWVEWAMGRYGGGHGHGTTPGMFYRLWHHRAAKYIGTFGILISFGVGVYYVYIMSWTLGYSFFSLTGKYMGITSKEEMGLFLSSYQGITNSSYFKGIDTAYIFYLISLALTIYILSKGVVRGLERLAKIGMPLLLIFGIILVVRIFTLGTPNPEIPENSINAGLGFMWNPDFASLKNPKVWLAAAGQVFFTLSVGFGAIQTYSSYIKRKDDVALNGMSTAATNSFVEVILGGSIAIPIRYRATLYGLSAGRISNHTQDGDNNHWRHPLHSGATGYLLS